MQKPDRPEPPRAIILPELKQNPGSQFGPIGCKVPNPTKSTWNDSPAAPNPVNHNSRMLPPSTNQTHTPPSLIPPPTPGLTIMQQLQAERRQREEDYVRRQHNWPGFETQSNGIPSNNFVESLWDTPSNQGNQGLWGSIGNVWPSSVFNTGFNYPETNETAEKENENLGFDSLSLSSIWSAPSNQNESESNSWSSLFNNNKKEM